MICGFGDFDFLIGHWKVHHRQLRGGPARSRGWQEFAGRAEVHKILGGFGVLDENILFEPHGTYRSVFLRTFDTEANSWSIWWYDSRVPAHPWAPLTGKFEGGIGTFTGERVIEGAASLVRYVWTRTDDTPRCEQSVSANHGISWETNWIMEFRRAS